jgi:uroporphyrinogen III methyltransferase / synthase
MPDLFRLNRRYIVNMEPVANGRALSGLTILVSPNSAAREVATELGRQGARVLAWPAIDIGEPENYVALDEAIENLWGYDWLILQSGDAVNSFLRRFQILGHEISELDDLRVCGVGEAAIAALEESQVHVDVIPDGLSFQLTFEAIETYVGGCGELRGLNLLGPVAGISPGYLRQAIEEAGGRLDLVTAYRTCAANEPDFARLQALITGGGIDCIAFASSSEPREISDLFDTNDLGLLLAGAAVACFDASTAEVAASLGLKAVIVSQDADARALRQAIATHFRTD